MKSPRKKLTLFILAILVVLLARPASHHARAAGLLMAFSDTKSKPEVREERLGFEHAGRTIPARLYTPAGGGSSLPGIVLVHGVHHLGIEEPRLERFARAIAAAGVVVMTPQVDELADYQVAPASIDTVGAAMSTLAARLDTSKVGLMGTSFGGGIALLTAADARYADRVSFVVAVGAHDDLERISRFFIDDEIAGPDGNPTKLGAHGYGKMVLVYSHAEDFFPAEDVPAAKDALRLWLWEERDEARRTALRLSPASKEKMDKLFGDGKDALHAEVLAAIEKHAVEMKAVSPHGHLGTIRANVYLLHGAGDTVVPATETLWLAHDVPPSRLRTVLVSPAIEHVELKSPSTADELALVHFMGQVIGEAEASR